VELRVSNLVSIQFYDASTLVHPTEKVFTAIDVSNDQLITGLILEYTVRMGVDARVIALATRRIQRICISSLRMRPQI